MTVSPNFLSVREITNLDNRIKKQRQKQQADAKLSNPDFDKYHAMASFSTYFPVFIVIFKLNAYSANCASLQNPERNILFYSEPEEFFRGDNNLNPPVHPVEVQGWPSRLPQVGQIVAVAINPNHQPVIFHRGPRVWDENTFNDSHHYQYVSEGPITVNTLLTLEPETGDVVDSWGQNFFYLPHGLAIDNYGYYYMTDIGLHQVFKFQAHARAPLLILGRKFEPGSGLHHFCKPTDVAVASTGEIFVADGYCNSRIMKYDSNGNLLYILPQNEELLPLKIPHSITLLEDMDMICIADRESMRVVCPGAGLKNSAIETNPVSIIQEPDMGRIFAVASYGNKVFAVNGPTSPLVQIKGITIDPMSEIITDQWTTSEGFQNPHDVEVCQNTSSVYVTEIGPNRVWKFKLRKP